jgi:LIVCS family branched-chain amino acid:cation transporter
MKRLLPLPIWAIGFAVFAMLFGATNLLFPLKVGATAGQHVVPALLGFLLTAVFLPFIGLLTMVLFDGNYQEYFQRIGKIPGKFLILCCILILGPFLAIPRSVALSYQMVHPFMPSMTLSLFSIIFLVSAFIIASQERFILPILAYVVSPFLFLLLGAVLIKGFMTPSVGAIVPVEAGRVFMTNVKYGFSTLDLLATIFFAALMLTLLKQVVKYVPRVHITNFTWYCLLAGGVASLLLGIVYCGLIYLGWYHAAELQGVPEELLFNVLAIRLFGEWAWLVMVSVLVTVILSTVMALLVITAYYVDVDVFKSKLGYIPSLLLMTLVSFFSSYWGMQHFARFTYGPVALILYPVVIMLTLCNLAYKVAGIRAVKIPVALTFIVSVCVCSYFMFLR